MCLPQSNNPLDEAEEEEDEGGGLQQGGWSFPFNSEEITVSSEIDTPFILQDDEGPHQSITCRKTLRLFILQALRGVNKNSKKGLFLDLLKSVTVLQSSRIWKTVIHHCLGSLDTWLWPWAINSITDVLQQLRLNNYTEEERTFSTRPGSLMDGYKYG